MNANSGFSQLRWRTATVVACAALVALLALVCGPNVARLWAADDANSSPGSAAATRPAWTTSRLVGSPEPPLPLVTERVYPGLEFRSCLDLVALPGSDRMLVAEQGGKIVSFRDDPDVSTVDLVADLAREIPGVEQVYAIALHPQFASNRYCYVCYIRAANLEDGTHIARFRVTESDPPRLDIASETTIITWLSGGHNGCCLKFGPDGYLYISTGDGAGPNPPDPLRAGQDISNLLSAILRIDVDRPRGDANYSIPPDNPFIDTPGARPEIWAYGLRNPWRMSFDRQTGDLWVGDVGWELWEMMHRVERGGNYGWSILEGHQPTNPEWARGPTAIIPPLIEHPHSESSSITAGISYYGDRLPQLQGMHLYGDYDTGKIWGFRYRDGRVVDHKELADTTLRIVGFGERADGEALILDHASGTLHRLVGNPRRSQSGNFPRRLSDTGLFDSVAEQRSAAGVVNYSIVAPAWADHATTNRWVAVPQQLSIQAEGTWQFPANSVLVKTISLEMRHGDPTSSQPIETQILHFDGQEWQPYTYAWDDDRQDAVLVESAGRERTLQVADDTAPGGLREQTWRFAGRAECQRCHNRWAGPLLAFQPAQLATAPTTDGVSQLAAWARIKLLDRPVPVDPHAQSQATDTSPPRRVLVSPTDETAPLDLRARAYLHTNCAHCHRENAGGAVSAWMPYELSLSNTHMLAARPTQGTFGIAAAQVIAPGQPYRSVLAYRLAKLGGGRMPHIGSSEVDAAGVELMMRWISSLDGELTANERPAPEGASTEGVSPQAAELSAAELQRSLAEHLSTLLAARDALQSSHRAGDSRELGTSTPANQPLPPNSADLAPAEAAAIESLLSSTSGALALMRAIDRQELTPSARVLAVELGSRHRELSVRDLYERFLPATLRVRRLGSLVRPAEILQLAGDAQQGQAVFWQTTGVACKNCHRVGEQGVALGPDLTKIGQKYSTAQLLESILEPSKRIDPQFVTHVVETQDGRVLTGLVVEKNGELVVLRDAQNVRHDLAAAEVAQLVPQAQSLMPDLLYRDLTAQQLADLLAYLASLK